MQRLSSCLALVVAATTLAVGGPSAAAAPGDPTPVTVLSGAEVGGYDVASTDDGTVVAVWEQATARRTRVVAAVRPAGADWQRREVLASWPPRDVRGPRGEPSLVAGPSGSVLAVWVDEQHRVVRATWRATRGWAAPRRLSGRHERAQGPRAASNDLGPVAVTWQRRTSDRALVRSAVRRGSGWFVSTVGRQGPRGLGAEPALVGIDDGGNVSAAWYRLRPKPRGSGDGPERAQNLTLASRLSAGTTAWEQPHAFVGGYEPYVDGDHPSLVVEDDGTARVGDWAGAWDAPQPGPMWVRSGDGPWAADDRAPYADRFVTNDAGGLISWADSDAVAEDAVHTRGADGTWSSADIRATAVVLDDAGHAAAVGVRQDTLVVWLRDGTGVWGPEQVLVQNATRQNDRGDEPVAAASIAPDGTVTVLWGTYANEFPGDHPERGPDLRSVQFDATGR